MKISVGELSYAITNAMQQYGTVVAEIVDDALDTTAKDTIEGLKFASPKDSGKYSGGWAKKTTRSRRGFRQVAIKQSKKPGLTHLLEHGHARRGGGRKVPPRPHIADAQDFADYELNALIQEGIRKQK